MKDSTDIVLYDKATPESYRVYLIHDIFKQDPVYADIPVGIGLWKLLGEPENPDIFYLEIDGVAIPSHLLSTTQVHAGQLVDIKKVPHGDDDSFLRGLLQVVILVISYYVPPLAGLGKFGTAMLQAGIITAGQLLINALVPIDQPDPDNTQPAPLNNIGVTRNRLEPFAIVPRMFGKIRQYPPYAANPYTEVAGNTIWLNALFCIGEGYEYEITDIRVGTTDITELEGVNILKTKTPDYPDVYQETLDITLDQDSLDPNGDDAVRATQSNTTRASVDISFPRGIGWMEYDGDKRALAIDFSVEYRENGTADPWVTVTDQDWRKQTTGDTRGLGGNPSNEPYNSFDDEGVSTSINWPTSSGPGGDDIQPVPSHCTESTLNSDYFTTKGKSFDGFRLSIKWTFPESNTWDIRVKRRSLYKTSLPGSPMTTSHNLFTENRISETFTWTALRSFNDDATSAVDDSGDLWYMLVRMRANDQLSGSLESFNYLAEAYTRTYNGTSWDAPSKNRNPAWAFCDVFTGNSIAEAIDDSDFIIDDIKDWADWCDTESFTFDFEFVEEKSLFDVLRQVSSAGRASLSQREGKFTVITDNAATDPVQMFTKRNSRGFKGSRVFLNELHGVKVRYRSESEDYQWTERGVYAGGYDEDNATQLEVVELLGIVQDDQAYRMGLRFMAEAIHRQEFYTFTVDFEHLIAQRGDTVLIQNESMLIGSGTARITDITGSVVTLDASFVVESGKTYVLRFRSHKVASPSYDISLATVTAPSSGTDVSAFTVDSVPTEADVGDLVIFGESGSEIIRCKVLEVQPKDELSAAISATPEGATIYTADTGEIPSYTPIIATPPNRENVVPPIPDILTIESYGIGTTQPTGEQTTRVIVTYGFDEVDSGYGGPLFIQIAYREWDATEDEVGSLKFSPWILHDQGSIIFTDLQNGENYQFFIRSRTTVGVTSLYSLGTEHVVTSERTIITEPIDVFTVTGFAQAILVQLDVTSVIQQDISYVEVWYSTTNNRTTPTPSIYRNALPSDLTAFTNFPFTFPISSADTYYVWARLVNKYQQASAWYPSSPTAGLSVVVSASADGRSVYVGNVFKRAASPPSTPAVDDGEYNFTTQTLTPPSTWFVAPPAGSNPLYVSTGSFSIIGPTGTDPTVTWTATSLLVQDGADGSPGSDGDDGLSVHVANVYKRAASPPSTPSADDGQYNFTTQTLTPPSTWFVEPPAGTDPLYISTGSFSIVGQTGIDTTVTWTSPDVLVQDGADGSDGDDGDDGLSVYVANVYKRAASPPSTPSADDGQYNFTTSTLTPPSTWFVEPPAGSNPLYVSTGSFSIVGQTGIDTTVTWTAPDLLVQDGSDGDDGLSVHVANIFKRSPTVPSTPSVDDGSYNFTTNTLTPPSGWFENPPTGDDPLYTCVGSFSIVGQSGTDTTVTWTAPDLLLTDAPIAGNALNLGRQFTTLSRWFAHPTSGAALESTFTIETPASPPVWDTVLQSSVNGNRDFWSEIIPIDNTKKYRVNIWAKQVSGARTNYLAVAFLDSSKTNIAGSGGGSTGWTGLGTYHYWEVANSVFPGSWTKYTFDFGGDALATFPTASGGAFYLVIGALAPGGGSGATVLQFGDYHITGLSDDGINASINYADYYASFETNPDVVTPAQTTATFDTAKKWVGNQSLKLVASAANGHCHFGNASNDYNIPIPANKKWILSGYANLTNANSPKTTNNTQLYIRSDNAGAYYGQGSPGSIPADGAWYRFETICDLTSDPSTNVILRADNDSFNSAGDTTMHFDGLQLELDDGTGRAREYHAPALDGDDAISNYLTNEAHVVASLGDGTGYNLTTPPSGGTHKVFLGLVDKTTASIHSIVGGTDNGDNWTKVQNGLTMTILEATGVYTLSGASWTTDSETFTLRATYLGVLYDKVYTITKAKAGAPGSGIVNMPLSCQTENYGTLPRTASVIFKRNGVVDLTGFTDVNWYTNAPDTDIGDYYEVRCVSVVSGSWDTQPAAIGEWIVMTSDRTWSMTRTTGEGAGWDQIDATFQIRLLNETGTVLDSMDALATAAYCNAGTSAIPPLAILDEVPETAYCGAKWTTVGNVYTRENITGSWGSADSAWKGSCPNDEYEIRWNQVSGDALDDSDGSDGVWYDASLQEIMVSYIISTEDSKSGNFSFECRRKSDQSVIITDAFTMDCEIEVV